MALSALIQPETISVLLIEDSPDDAAFTIRALVSGESLYSFKITRKDSLEEGLGFLRASHVDVVLLDLNLPDAWDITAIQEVHRLCPDLPIVVVTGYSDMKVIHKALRNGAQEFLRKGECNGETIRQGIYQAIVRKQVEQSYERGDKL